MTCRQSVTTMLAVAALVGGVGTSLAAPATAAPNPETEFLYDVSVRRQYHFPNNDPVRYGHIVCDKVGSGEGYGQVMGDVRGEVTPNDEAATNYLVSYAVNLLCPELIWQLRKSAAGYQPPPGEWAPETYY
ncbi:DUF732 domain-containing protein [Mycobacterium sp. 050134]|uniref:DUF732 domain-containing protein n=1 Tax=Mycobacterium sp. 050134 TaxID=3096111 RepID=UPI002ED8BA2F